MNQLISSRPDRPCPGSGRGSVNAGWLAGRDSGIWYELLGGGPTLGSAGI